METLSDYDPADALTSEEVIEVFMADACETSDPGHIAKALLVIARAKPRSVSKQTIPKPRSPGPRR